MGARPLSEHAIRALRSLDPLPKPCVSYNPSVVHRLMRDNLVEVVRLPSPFHTHKGKLIQHMRLTDSGRAVLDPVTESERARR